ncbi:MAG: hypothetical protein E7369_03825 [Clostridiales bacterium]|nr:hypothetical protein [Clostridiales bacterium]
MFKGTEKLWDILGEILAVAMVITYAILILNSTFHFIPMDSIVMTILQSLKTWGSLILIGVVGFEAMSKRNFIFRIIFLALLAIIVIFMFFPGTYANFIGIVAR